jgi:uncharacterized protein YggU (UPF0235/DUF167 family)
MNIEVKVKSTSGPPQVTRVREGSYEVVINEKPVQGKANEAVIRMLARHLGVPQARLRIVRGRANRSKLLRLLP